MTPYERLLAEELPTGHFGNTPARTPKPATPPPDPNAAQHRAQLLAALTQKPARHLHALPPAA